MSGCSPRQPVLVLDYDPAGIPEAQKERADLVLCGHTHDGRFFLCTLITRYWYGKEHCHGIHREGHTSWIISSGTGFFQTPVRVGTDSEIILIQLTGGEAP